MEISTEFVSNQAKFNRNYDYDDDWKAYRSFYLSVTPATKECGIVAKNAEILQEGSDKTYLMDSDQASITVNVGDSYFKGIPPCRSRTAGRCPER